jgi:hypothetical protein
MDRVKYSKPNTPFVMARASQSLEKSGAKASRSPLKRPRVKVKSRIVLAWL